MFYELNIYNNFINIVNIVLKYTMLCTMYMWWVVGDWASPNLVNKTLLWTFKQHNTMKPYLRLQLFK